jgi:hypothetical protein
MEEAPEGREVARYAQQDGNKNRTRTTEMLVFNRYSLQWWRIKRMHAYMQNVMIFNMLGINVALSDAWCQIMDVLSLHRPREVGCISQLHALNMIVCCRLIGTGRHAAASVPQG